MKKILTIGIPAYKAETHISDALSSVQIQTFKDKVSVIIASDFEKHSMAKSNANETAIHCAILNLK